MKPNARWLSLAVLAAIGLLGRPAQGDEKRVVTVMTRNMDAGTDLNLVMAATDPASLVQALGATLAEVKASGIPARAARLADEIAARKPDLVGLQEVTLWRTGPLSLQPAGASEVLYDQLDLLMSELAKRKLRYTVVVAQTLMDIEVPVPTQDLNLRLTDRDAILARSDMQDGEFHIFSIETHTMQNLLTLPILGGVTIPRSWESADVKVRGKSFRFVNTHLETTSPAVPETVMLQLAQTREILDALEHTDLPVVLLGDFNANAEPGPEHTGSVESIVQAGFQDVWKTLFPSDPGYTWPLFGEDQFQGAGVIPNERIDLVFARGLTPLTIERLSVGAFTGQPASDHAGVAATVQIGK